MNQPVILHKTEAVEESADYTQGSYKRRYRYGDAVYYFAVHPEFYRDDTGLDFSGNKIIVLTSPLGTHFFTAEPYEDSWNFQNAPAFIPQEILDMVRHNICDVSM